MTDEPRTTDTVSEPEMIEKEKYLRLAADFDNYRKTMERQVADAVLLGGQAVVLKLISIIDLLEQATSHAPPEVRAQEQWWKGMEQIRKHLDEQMKHIGIERITTEGMVFDPNVMEAVQTVAVDNPSQSRSVHGEIQAGYTMHGKVIRPAKVSVYQ